MLRTYLKFLSRNKLYTFVTIVGFGISLMFVVLLGLFAMQEYSIDKFQKNADRIYLICDEGYGFYCPNPLPVLLQERMPGIESFCRVANSTVDTIINGKQQKLEVLAADSTFFTMFTAPLLYGDARDVLKTRGSIVLSGTTAKRLFGEINRALGKVLELRGRPYTVTGIMEDMSGLSQIPPSDAIINYSFIETLQGLRPNILDSWGDGSFSCYVMAKAGGILPDVVPPSIMNEFGTLCIFYDTKSYPDSRLRLLPFEQSYFTLEKSDYHYDGSYRIRIGDRTKMNLLFALSLLILLVSSANYINLCTAQTTRRGKEAALRNLYGDGKGGAFRRLFSETLLVTGFAFLLGIGLAVLFARPFLALLDATLDWSILQSPWAILGIVSLWLLLSLLSGLIPAFIFSRYRAIEVVQGTFRRHVKLYFTKMLSVSQYVLAIALLICSIFVFKQVRFMETADLGFRSHGLLRIVNDGKIDSVGQCQLRSQLMSIPGVERVCFINCSPFGEYGGCDATTTVEGKEVSFRTFYAEDKEALKVLDIRVRPTGIDAGNATVYVNRRGYNILKPEPGSQAVEFWGKTYYVGGIVPDLHLESLHTPTKPIIIFTNKMRVKVASDIIVSLNDAADKQDVRRQVSNLFMRFTHSKDAAVEWTEDRLRRWYLEDEKMMRLVGIFSGLILLILAMGVLATSLYVVQRHKKEIAIRKVNGATVGQMLLLLLRTTFRQFAVAFVIACPIGWWATQRWLDRFAYKISLSWWVFVLAGLIVLLLSILTVLLQTWRAARANPVRYLCAE